MKQVKIILSEKNLIFELINSSEIGYFFENYSETPFHELLKKYLRKIYSEKSFEISNSIIRAVNSLQKLPDRVITINSDKKWRRDNDPYEYSRIHSQAKLLSNLDLYRSKKVDSNPKPDEKPQILNQSESNSLIEKLKYLVKSQPDNPDVHFRLGKVFLEIENYEDSIDELREAISLESDNADYYYYLGYSYQKSGKYELAIMEYKTCLDLDPERPVLHYNLGNVFSSIGKYYEAIPFYQNAIVLKPFFTDAYISLGRAFNKLELYDEAIYVFEEALSIEQDNEEIKNELKIAYQIKRKVQSTELNNIGIAYAEKDKLEKAIEKFEKAITINPDDPEIYYNLAFAYFKHGDLDKAVSEFKNVIRISPHFSDVHIVLGEVYEKQGKIETAINEYQKFISLHPKSERENEIMEKINRLRISN